VGGIDVNPRLRWEEVESVSCQTAQNHTRDDRLLSIRRRLVSEVPRSWRLDAFRTAAETLQSRPSLKDPRARSTTTRLDNDGRVELCLAGGGGLALSKASSVLLRRLQWPLLRICDCVFLATVGNCGCGWGRQIAHRSCCARCEDREHSGWRCAWLKTATGPSLLPSCPCDNRWPARCGQPAIGSQMDKWFVGEDRVGSSPPGRQSRLAAWVGDPSHSSSRPFPLQFPQPALVSPPWCCRDPTKTRGFVAL
jgi:hypothetical protein